MDTSDPYAAYGSAPSAPPPDLYAAYGSAPPVSPPAAPSAPSAPSADPYAAYGAAPAPAPAAGGAWAPPTQPQQPAGGAWAAPTGAPQQPSAAAQYVDDSLSALATGAKQLGQQFADVPKDYQAMRQAGHNPLVSAAGAAWPLAEEGMEALGGVVGAGEGLPGEEIYRAAQEAKQAIGAAGQAAGQSAGKAARVGAAALSLAGPAQDVGREVEAARAPIAMAQEAGAAGAHGGDPYAAYGSAPGDLGAAQASTDVTKEYAQNLADRLQTNLGRRNQRDIELLDIKNSVPEKFLNEDVQRDWYRMGEAEHAPSDPDYQAHMQPLKDREARANEEYHYLKGETNLRDDPENPEGDPEASERLGDPYMRRMTKGLTPEIDELAGAAKEEPFAGRQVQSKIKTKAGSLNEASYYTLVGEDGERIPVRRSDDGKTLQPVGQKGPTAKKLPASIAGPSNRVQRLPTAKGNIKPGEQVIVNGKKMTLGRARAQEITDAGGPEYHQHALLATIENIREREAVNDSLRVLRDLKESPQYKANTALARADGSAPRGTPENWRKPNMPAFAPYYMHPKIANVLDDFYSTRSKNYRWVEHLNNAALRGLFFLNPFIHAQNVGAHWFTARGFDWAKPTAYWPMVKTMGQAAHEVWTMGPKYQAMLKDNAALLAAGTRNRDFHEKLMRGLNMMIEKDPGRWGPVIKAARMQGPADLIAAINKGSQETLWNIGDVFMMQRILELEGKGMSPIRAIQETHKHIPTYRLPQTIAGSRDVQQFLNNSLIASFSRYHYGMIASYVHMAHDMLSPSATLEQRVNATGQAVATAFLSAFMVPAINHELQQLTGNKHAQLPPRGSATVPALAWQWYNGQTSFPQIMGRLLTLAPAPKFALEQYQNRDFFTGRPISHENIFTKGGAMKEGGALLDTFGGGASQLLDDYTQGGVKGIGKGVLERSTGVQLPTAKQVAAKAAYEQRERSATRTEARETNRTAHKFFGY